MNQIPSPPLMAGKTALAMLDTAQQLGQVATPAESQDAEIIQSCDAIMHIYNNWGDAENYDAACRSIEKHAEIIAPIPAHSPAEIQAKARVVYALSRIGMAGYAARILAASLATDVLAGGVA